MLKNVLNVSAVAALLAGIPAVAWAQASVTGTVRDTSGAVLPGVTVEAASSSLIEKARAAVTDGSGQFRIPDLPSGSYRVTFSLPGFATVQRDGVELSGSFTATINVDMRVGALEETITITGDAPIVNVQSTVRQDVLKGDLITELPVARNVQNLAILIPGMAVGGTLDVGGLRGGAEVSNFSAHGGGVDDGRLLVDGMNVGGPTSRTTSAEPIGRTGGRAWTSTSTRACGTAWRFAAGSCSRPRETTTARTSRTSTTAPASSRAPAGATAAW